MISLDEYLRQQISAWGPPALNQAMAEALRADSRLLRGRLTCAAADVVDLEPALAVPLAAAVEMVHSASLALDRGDRLGALAGLSLVSRALWLVGVATTLAGAPADASQMALERLSEAVGAEGLSGGRAAEWTHAPEWDVERVRDKTSGSLLAAGMGMVGDLAGAPPATGVVLIEFGRRLGIAAVAESVADPVEVLESLGSRATVLAGLAREFLE